MRVISGLNLALAFALELGMLAALAYWGFQTGNTTSERLLLGLGPPAAAVLVWSRWLAPTSGQRLPMPWLKVVTAAMFMLAAVALYAADRADWAVMFGVAAVVNVGLALALGQH
jgi:Protein of unknown function (DUF2568)